MHGLDPDRIAVAGDSVGGNMTAALALMAQDRGDVRFVHQSMYYPVTDAAMDTGSYAQFAEGYYLTREGDGVVLGRLRARRRAARASRTRHRCGRATSSSPASRRRS